MPKTRTNKRSADNSSARSETRHSRKPSSRVPVVEKKTGLTPAIRFCDNITKKDDDEEAEIKYTTIKVKIDPNGTDVAAYMSIMIGPWPVEDNLGMQVAIEVF